MKKLLLAIPFLLAAKAPGKVPKISPVKKPEIPTVEAKDMPSLESICKDTEKPIPLTYPAGPGKLLVIVLCGDTETPGPDGAPTVFYRRFTAFVKLPPPHQHDTLTKEL